MSDPVRFRVLTEDERRQPSPVARQMQIDADAAARRRAKNAEKAVSDVLVWYGC